MAGIPREHPLVLSHGLCECGDPVPMPRDGGGADSWGRVGVDEDLGFSPWGVALTKYLLFAVPQWPRL